MSPIVALVVGVIMLVVGLVLPYLLRTVNWKDIKVESDSDLVFSINSLSEKKAAIASFRLTRVKKGHDKGSKLDADLLGMHYDMENNVLSFKSSTSISLKEAVDKFKKVFKSKKVFKK